MYLSFSRKNDANTRRLKHFDVANSADSGVITVQSAHLARLVDCVDFINGSSDQFAKSGQSLLDQDQVRIE